MISKTHTKEDVQYRCRWHACCLNSIVDAEEQMNKELALLVLELAVSPPLGTVRTVITTSLM